MTLSEIRELPVLFIIGRGRSGSTLLRTMLDANPEMTIPHESRFVQYMYYRYAKVKLWDAFTRKRFLNDLLLCPELPDTDMEGLQRSLELFGAGLTFADACKCVYLNTRSVFPKTTIRIIGDKNPRYVFFIKRLLYIFPNARFVHIVRDCRDSTLSFYKVSNMPFEHKNAAFLAYRWMYYNRQVLPLKYRNPERIFTVKYEELVSRPEEVLLQLCKFSGLHYDPRMLSTHERVADTFAQESDVFKNIHQGLKKPVNDNKSEVWKKEMTVADIRTTNAIAGKCLQEMGYEVQMPRNRSIYYLRNLHQLVFSAVPLYAKKFLYPRASIMRIFYSLKN